MAEVVFGLLGAVVGAGAALLGQFVVRRREERERWVGVLLEDCAKIYVLEDSFTGALWEAFGERQDPARLRDWSRTDRALAAARLTIVCTDEQLVATVDSLRDNGREMWRAARSGSQSDWERLRRHHHECLADLVSAARKAAREGRTI